jgi:hypothetical protein
MKTKLIIGLLMLTCSAFAQNFSETTPAIRLNMAQPSAGTTLPSIVWITPRLERTNSVETSVVFQADVASDVPLKSVWLEMIVNGKPVPKQIAIQNQFAVSVNLRISLLAGENTVRLFAENIQGGLVSSVRSVLSGKDALEDAVDINRKDYALLFVTNTYDHMDDLVNPIFDGRTINGLLTEKYGFQTEVVENASNDQILAKITEYNLKKFNPQDQLFVFFAGHGVFDEALKEGYVVASNSLANDPGRASYVSHILIRERLDNINCEHIFLMMDVCFGGTFDQALAKVRGEQDDENIDKEFLIKKLTKRTRKFLTSGSKEYVPDGQPGRHSPFAEKFILALREKGGGTGRILSLVELRTYFLKLSTEPRFGSFGTRDDPASDFVFVAKQ